MIYKIDNFQINTQLREIRDSDEVLNIEPKVYDLIVYFIENPNKAISKDELFDEIWPGVAVSETALTRAIMKARKVINDGQSTASYIQTVHGHGYKFIADIETIDPPAESLANSKPSDPQESTKLPLLKVSVLMAVLISFIGVGLIYLTQSPSDTGKNRLAILPIINKTNDESLSWTSIGLMSLAAQVVNSKNNMTQVSEWETAQEQFVLDDTKQDEQTIEELKQQLSASYIVISSLSSSPAGFLLSYTVYNPNGAYENNMLEGDNPTTLAQQMANEIAQLLPGHVTSSKQLVISEDSFTNELFSRGKAYQLQGFSDKAYDHFKLAVEQEPNLFAPRYELATTKREQNKLQEAEADFQTLLENFDQFKADTSYKIKTYNSLATTYKLQGELDKAKSAYETAYGLAVEFENLNYQATTAYNLGVLYKNLSDYDQAKQWLTEATLAFQSISDEPEAGIVYLQGQIERDLGNIDKAESLFTQAFELFMQEKIYRHAAAVSSAHSRLLKSKGRYKESAALLKNSLELKTELNDVIGINDAKLSLVDLYMAEGRLQDARMELLDTMRFAEENNIMARDNYMSKADIMIDFNQNRYQMVLDKIKELPKDYKSRTLDMVAMKSRLKLGNTTEIKQWLQEYQNLKSGTNNNMRLYWLDLENFYLENLGSTEERIRSYKERIELSESLGHITTSTQTRIKLAYELLEQNQLQEAESLFNNIQLQNLDWWQIDLLQAVLLRHNNEFDKARSLANKAKSNAYDTWSEKDEERFLWVSNPTPLIDQSEGSLSKTPR